MLVPKHPLSEWERDLALLGYCPFCMQQIRNWKISNSLSFRRKQLERGIDDITGHTVLCKYKEINL